MSIRLSASSQSDSTEAFAATC
ncbi:hypothetical protein DSL72_000880 [Monilinia vaccinii-corymbosi]|uniref:Uncharacterized protein n=1 Tax=Monilinia vaccinii-corymbosi TaxID=61207 RepID=A0A8A3PAG0_9HELO|nr:hypothetical protein DSL72_000880 [Monilinia vaccinii-corymbosi]